MEQAPDSPITGEQLKGCIDGLKRADRSEFTQHIGAALCIGAYIEIMLLMQSPMVTARFTWHTFTDYSLALLLVCVCYLTLVWCLLYGIAKLMQRHAAHVFAKTSLVAHVLGLPSDVAAYRGWHNAWLVGEVLSRKQAQYDLRRRVKAVYTRFGAWSKHFGCSPEPWAVRLSIYAAVCAPVCCVWVFEWLIPQPSRADLLILLAGFYILSGLMVSVFQGRRTGIRTALIDYFEADAARYILGEAEHGASDG
jgi:hypothetical protein